ERVNISIPKSICARTKLLHSYVLVPLNDDDNTRKHLLRLFGIAGISDCEGNCYHGKKHNGEASHGSWFLIFSRAKDIEPGNLAEVIVETFVAASRDASVAARHRSRSPRPRRTARRPAGSRKPSRGRRRRRSPG